AILTMRIGPDHAGINRKGFTADQAFYHAATYDDLENLPHDIGFPEATMPILGEGRVIRHCVVQTKTAEPTIREIEVHLLTEPAFRPYAEAITDDQHPDH